MWPSKKPSDSTVVDSRTWICREDAAPSSQPFEPPSRAETSRAAELSGCRVELTLVGRARRAINYSYCHPPFLIENKQEISTCLFFVSRLWEFLLCRDTLRQITLQEMTYVAREILPLRAQKHACGVTRLHSKLVLNPGYGGYVMHIAHRPAPLFIYAASSTI